MESGATKRNKLKEKQASQKCLLCKIPDLSNLGFALLQDDAATTPVDPGYPSNTLSAPSRSLRQSTQRVWLSE